MSSTQNSPMKRGLGATAIGFDTITSHDWHDDTNWPEEGDPPEKTSKWVLEPEDGRAYVLDGVLIKFTHGMSFPSTSKMIIEGIIADGVGPIILAQYDSVAQFIARADKMDVVDLPDPGGGPFRKPFMVLEFNFSKHIFLWSSAGLTGDPPAPKVDNLGIPKFKKMIARIGDDAPYTYHDASALEIACSRYFVHEYLDPDFGV